jgi:cation-transporting ATPase F
MNKGNSEQWHSITEIDVLKKTNTSLPKGLKGSEILERQRQFGINALTEKKGTHPIVMFLLQFNQPLIYILLAAGIITAFLGEWVDSGVILGVVIVNAIIGYIQESKALKAIASLAKAMTSETTVIRDGRKQRIKSTEVTIGDIVVLQSGDKIPADLRLLQVRELQIDESALTGESIPVTKQVKSLDVETVLADRSNMAYSSTLVTYGVGTGVVIEIGDETEIGRINEMIASANILATPLTRQIARFSKWLLIFIITISVFTFLLDFSRGVPLVDIFLATVGLAVAAIPEGLPAAMTIMLAIGVSKMAKRNAIIRKLPAVETLGSTTVICSDKTGTLTQNQMTVQEIYVGSESFNVTGVGYTPEGIFKKKETAIDPMDNLTLRECLYAGLLCNDAALVFSNEKWQIEGDPTEGALITAAQKAGLLKETVEQKLLRIDVIPFESQYQYMATLHHDVYSGKKIVYLKGSVESILSRCTNVFLPSGQFGNFNEDEYRRMADEIATKGLRILAFARVIVESDKNTISHDDLSNRLTFLGFQAMIDPPRPEAMVAVKACQDAGINVKMITGDYELTALAIAQKIGIINSMDINFGEHVLNGKKIAVLSDDELAKLVKTTTVFARVAPQDKLRLVKAFQANGEIIAMTGDGVNDAPALRQANIGIAMGITGTEVAKETADMVLTDDNFATIEAAIEEGRGVYDNLIKFITWTLPTNCGEGGAILIAIIAGLALPILPVQILWINMTTAVLLGLMLVFEPKEPGLMNRTPRNPKQPILSKTLIARIGVVGMILIIGAFMFYDFALMAGRSEAAARTIAVNIFIFGEIFYLFNCRSLRFSMFRIGLFSNKFLLLGVFCMIVLQLFFTYMPFMNIAFQSEPIALQDWGCCISVGVIIYVLIELEKRVRNRLTPNNLKKL